MLKTQEETITRQELIKVHNALFEIPSTYRADMRVPARIFVNDAMLNAILADKSLLQMVNITTLPGIEKYAFAMPDIHQGYGFPIGGVAATTADYGVISPGGIGYDINCGVRLLAAPLTEKEIRSRLSQLADILFASVPSGVGRSGNILLHDTQLDNILARGAHFMLEQGYGDRLDIEHCEETGCMNAADPAMISDRAKKRGKDQLGTLGSGNHFLEIQKVDALFDKEVAHLFGLELNMVTVMIHCGSRGLGHQTCTDYVQRMVSQLDTWSILLPDKELACAPIHSIDGKNYYAAMSAAANFAWANRHVIGHWVKESFKKIFGSAHAPTTVYDLSHNIGKKEFHEINGNLKELIVHRKGATRAFSAGRPEVPARYRSIGHPVLIPGTMGTAPYVLVGTQQGMYEAFGSCCHGAGRAMSRMQAKKTIRGAALRKELAAKGILIRCESDHGLAEEAPLAYKDVDNVIQIVEQAQLARPIARLKPLAVIKGN